MIGVTQNDTAEFALGYVGQDGEKGNPAHTGYIEPTAPTRVGAAPLLLD